jgi:probable F420-dependent oxidoreductase
MKIGVNYFVTDYGIDIRELAKALEDRGYDALFIPEHTHIPLSRKTPFPGGGELPKRYAHTHDIFVTLSFAAAVTKHLVLGTGICLLPQHEPIVTAKAIASLDQYSGGRFIFGIGGGWNVDEMENHGAQYKTRFKQMREHVLAMKALWTEEAASYHGEFVKFDPVWSYPKPLQKPHPPILLGGESDYSLKRIVEYCDGWLPRPRPGVDLLAGVAKLRRMAGEAGRKPQSIAVTVFSAPPDPATLATYEKAGIERASFALPDASRDEILHKLDEWAPLVSSMRKAA